jgi:predicted  nucleic acid-binding Zn-ribbon protein
MPRPTTITYEAVSRVALELMARGAPETNKAVLDALGGGSMSTLVPHLRAWREEQKARAAQAEIETPEPVLEHARDLAGRFWRDATAQANTAVDALRRDLHDQRQEAERQQAELLDHLATVEAERDAARDQCAALAARVEDLQASAAAAAIDAVQTEASMAALQDKYSAIEAALVKADERATSAQDLFAGFMRDLTMKPVSDQSPANHGPANHGPADQQAEGTSGV